MKVKYIKVSVSPPYYSGEYLTNLGRLNYRSDKNIWYNDEFLEKPEYWLQEVPDYEQELENMIDELILELHPATTCGDYQEVIDKAKSLLTKIKQKS